MSLTSLQQRVDELKKESAQKDAKIRILMSERGGLDKAVEGEAEMRALIEKYGLNKKLEGDVPLEMLMYFFQQAIIELRDPALLEDLLSKTEGLSLEPPAQERTNISSDRLNTIYSGIWEKMNVDGDSASKAVNNSGFLAGSDDLSREEQELLTDLLEDFQEAEQMITGPCILGKEEFAKRVAQHGRFQEIERETLEQLSSLQETREALDEYLQKVQNDANEVRKLLSEMSEEESAAFIENPPAEAEAKMMRMQILQMMASGGEQGGHGHSHGGEPCGGHGAPAPSHGHSHGGEPCGGHGAPAPPAPAHGHSHGGEPCGGHGH